MSLLVTINRLDKTMGSKSLFEGLSLGISERERIGLLGPNGAGKSTLLKIIAGKEAPDSGEVSYKKGLNLAFVAQEDPFKGGQTIWQAASERLEQEGLEASEAQIQAAIHLGMVGFEDIEMDVDSLSGGWKKRLSLAVAFAQEPDLLVLDEPTNHMDWDGILWLENRLKAYKKAFVLVSHDRDFLDNLCERTIEINKLYSDGYLSFDCGYRKFIERKQEYIEAQLNLQDSMSNKARREVDWLRAGVKARTTKSQSRIKEAHQLLDNLALVKSRNQAARAKVRVEIDASGKRSKKLVQLKKLTVAYGDHVLIKDLDLLLGPKTCLGLLGDNGSGKSSLLKVITGAAKNYTGDFYRADPLNVVYFDQKRDDLPQDMDLVSFLGDGSDYMVFKGESVHVASYASRFLFSSDKMKLKISQLSGGEQARLLIAKLLLQPADVLILDEPTNDLDIDSIEILEESIAAFQGLVILVSHDRYFLSALCHRYLALSGAGGWQKYPDLHQWLKERNATETPPEEAAPKAKGPEASATPKKKSVKLTYKEKQLAKTIEGDIARAETTLAKLQEDLEKPEVFSDHEKTKEVVAGVEACQRTIEDLYKAWEELDAKNAFS